MIKKDKNITFQNNDLTNIINTPDYINALIKVTEYDKESNSLFNKIEEMSVDTCTNILKEVSKKRKLTREENRHFEYVEWAINTEFFPQMK